MIDTNGLFIYDIFSYMNKPLIINLELNPNQSAELEALQIEFNRVCNSISLTVQASKCWNRVALHHMVYHDLRARFPGLGSQMICNAVFAVCKVARRIYQDPDSPWGIGQNMHLPLLSFSSTSPVFFDKHTLSLKDNKMSMYTLNGRMQFPLMLRADELSFFKNEKIKEILLFSESGKYRLHFHFAPNVTSNEKIEKDGLMGNLMITGSSLETAISMIARV